MELHERFPYPNLKEAIFGNAPEYTDKYDLSIYLRRIVILSAAFARAYYGKKGNGHDNMTSRALDKIIKRPFLSIDSSVSVLTILQNAGAELGRLGVSSLKIVSDKSHPEYMDLYEVKAILQDETGKFFNAATCFAMINKVLACIGFITRLEIENCGEEVRFVFEGETFDVSELFQYEFCYLYRAVSDVDPLATTFIPL